MSYFLFYFKARFIWVIVKERQQIISEQNYHSLLYNCCSGKKTTDIALRGVNLHGNTSIAAGPPDLN